MKKQSETVHKICLKMSGTLQNCLHLQEAYRESANQSATLRLYGLVQQETVTALPGRIKWVGRGMKCALLCSYTLVMLLDLCWPDLLVLTREGTHKSWWSAWGYTRAGKGYHSLIPPSHAACGTPDITSSKQQGKKITAIHFRSVPS